MHFRLEGYANGLKLDGPVISFSDLGEDRINIQVHPSKYDESQPMPDGVRPRSASVQAAMECEISDPVLLEFQAQTHDDVPMESYPKLPRRKLRSVWRELFGTTTRAINLLRWRSGARGSPNPFWVRTFRWSIDEQDWRTVGRRVHLRRTGQVGVIFSDESLRWIGDVLGAGGREPVWHDLWREAWEQRIESPRSSLILSIAAVEIGLKHCIKHLSPHDAAWFLSGFQSPSLPDLLTEYFPSLVRRSLGSNPPPPSMLKTVADGIRARNTLVHEQPGTGKYDKVVLSLEFLMLERLLWSTHNLLWMFDYYTGHEWAERRVGRSVRKEWLGDAL